MYFMKTKRILSLMLVCCLVLAVLTACKKEPGNDTSSASSTTANVESEDDGIFNLSSDIFGTDSEGTGSQAVSGSSGTASKGTTSQNTTVSSQPPREYEQVDSTDISKLPKYVQNAYKQLPNLKTDSEKKLTIMYHEKMTESPLLGYKYGITMETIVVPWTELMNRYIASVNSNKGPDILIDDYNFTTISKQYVQAWDSYVNLSDSMWKEEKAINDTFAVGGKHYMFIPKDPSTGGKLMYVLYNADVIKNANLETPSQLFAKNKWDWDAFEKIAEKLTNTTNKQYGAWLYNGPQAFVNSTGHDYIDFVNGRAKNMVKSAPVARAIQAYSDLIAKKAVYFGGNAETLVTRGDVAMAVTTIGGVMAAKDQILKGSCGFTAFPKDPQADSHYMPYMANGFYLAKGAKHPNNAAAFLVCWHYEKSAEYRRELNKELLELGDAKAYPEEIYNISADIDTKVKGTMHTWEMFGGEFGVYVSAVGSAINGGEPWSKIAAELSPLADAGIKSFYGG